jgi:hypothetical protein
MQRFSAVVRYIFTVILVPILIPVAAHFIEEQPQETANVVLKFLFDLSEQTWLRLTALSLGCFVAGLWVDWLLRRLDRSRAKERKELGDEMAYLGNYLGQIKFPFDTKDIARIMSCFSSANNLGIWAPDGQTFPFQVAHGDAVLRLRLSSIKLNSPIPSVRRNGCPKNSSRHCRRSGA